MGTGASRQQGQAGNDGATGANGQANAIQPQAHSNPVSNVPPSHQSAPPTYQPEETVQVVVPQGNNDEDSPLGDVGRHIGADAGAIRFLEDELPAEYLKKDLLGKGAFGEAYLVERTRDNKTFVGKVMDLHAMSSQDKKYAQTEILCLAHSMHFAVIQYVEHLVIDEDTVVIIMEYADNGDLYNNIKKRRATFTEREAGMYFVQLLLALDHIHRRRMIHRDIKSANVFMTKSGLIKLGDFGFSQQYDQTVSNECATTFLGTPYYLAPEMWKGMRYGKMADVWAAAIVLFEFLTGGRPFVANSMPSLKQVVLQGSFSIPDTFSRDMREFVQSALTLNPQRRPSAQDLLRTPLMQHYVAVFQKHVADATDIDAETKSLIELNIRESMQAIKDSPAPTVTNPRTGRTNTIRHESTVYKESDSGSWKERYLILEDEYVTLTLAKGKDAANGSDRSKRIPTESIVSTVPVAHSIITGCYSQRFAFAISTRSSPAIVFACDTEKERDEWVQKLLEVLEMA